MAFRNPAIAGLYLVRPAIQSPNYVLGSAGWTVNRDGTVEFNGGTFRGSLNIGNPAGQHFIVNNTSTTDALDIYNSSAQLAFSIDNNGEMHSYNVPSATECDITGGLLLFNNTTPALQFGTGANIAFASGVASAGALKINGGIPVGALAQPSLILNANTSTAQQDIQATQRGITGDVVQTDQGVNVNNLIHTGVYTFTTNASGNATFNHNCSFTPTGGWLACELGGGTGFSQYAWFTNPFNATQASAAFWNPTGGSVANANLTAYGIFVG